ncbi:hypothetical protein LguiA_036155 [Lonicera macranthoides]
MGSITFRVSRLESPDYFAPNFYSIQDGDTESPLILFSSGSTRREEMVEKRVASTHSRKEQ